MTERSLLAQALTRLDEAARHLRIDGDVLEKLKYPRETLKVRLMIRMDDGSRKSFMAWRCRYDDTRGPTKGGIRFHPDTTAEEVETLASSASSASRPGGAASPSRDSATPASTPRGSSMPTATASYFEWVQNRQGYSWSLDEVHTRLKGIMEAEGRKVWDLSHARGLSLRTAAYVHALGRLAEAIEAHGTQPFFTS